MKQQVETLAALLDFLEGSGLERAKNHKVIRDLLSSEIPVKEGGAFRGSLKAPVEKICRNEYERRIRLKLNRDEANLDTADRKLKTELLEMVETQTHEDAQSIRNLKEEQKRLLSVAEKKIYKALKRTISDKEDMEPSSLFNNNFIQRVVQQGGDLAITKLLDNPKGEILCTKVKDFALTRDSHLELTGILMQEIAAKVLRSRV